ncbi:MAG: NAD(P)-binding domain-containing protein [Bacteroidota bacterium]
MNIGFIGAGNVAVSLGSLLHNAGHTIKYATRTPNEGQVSILKAISFAEVVFFTIPYTAMKEVLVTYKKALKDKIVIDVTNPINITDWSPLHLGEDSGGEQTSRMLPESKVAKAFNTVFADVMDAGKQQFSENKLTVFIASDDGTAADLVKRLSEDAGFNGLVVGGIETSRYLEALAHLNIAIALNGGGTDAGFAYFQRK